MKSTLFVALVVALVLVTSGSATAQTASQTVNFTVPTLFRLSVTPPTITLDLLADDFTPGVDTTDVVTDNSTQYQYVHTNAGGAKITVRVQAALPAGINLSVELSDGAGAVDLTTTAQDARTGIARGAGSGTATYSLGADVADAATGQATVEFTIQSP